MKRGNGLFVVFEGIDGCGKSKQSRAFADRLTAARKYNHVLNTREPAIEENVDEIRRRLREETDAYSNPELMAQLYIEDRKQHVHEFVLPDMAKGIHVVSDRYKLSTIAYQSAQGLDMQTLIDLHKTLLVPDITFLIDLPVDIALARTDKKEGKFEQRDFQEIVRQNYLKAAEILGRKGELIQIVNGENPIQQVSDEVWRIFSGYFPTAVQ